MAPQRVFFDVRGTRLEYKLMVFESITPLEIIVKGLIIVEELECFIVVVVTRDVAIRNMKRL